MTIDRTCRVGPFRDEDGSGPRTAAARTDHLDSWRSTLREHFVALDVSGTSHAAPFAGSVRSTRIGHLSVADVASTAQTCARTARLAGADAERYLQVGLIVQGVAVVEQDGREAVLRPGRFVVYETDRPFSWHFDEPWRLLVLTWPRELVDLADDVSRAATARTLGDGPLGELVAAVLTEAVLAPPEPATGATGLAARLADELGALVTTTFPEHGGADGTLSPRGAADLRSQVGAYVVEHAEDTRLGVADLARAHHVSVRTLHRAFDGTGMTVGWLVRRLRLAHARRRLVDPHDAHLSVTDLAHACGFSDLPAFSRAFKLEYHETPSTYRRRLGPPTTAQQHR